MKLKIGKIMMGSILSQFESVGNYGHLSYSDN